MSGETRCTEGEVKASTGSIVDDIVTLRGSNPNLHNTLAALIFDTDPLFIDGDHDCKGSGFWRGEPQRAAQNKWA
jgi:hypothetical protein